MKKGLFFTISSLLVVSFCLLSGCTSQLNPHEPGTGIVSQPASVAKGNPDAPGLIDLDGVVGVGEGIDENGNPAVIVLTEKAGVSGILGQANGKPVKIHISGKICALGSFSAQGKPPAPAPVDPKARFLRPVPIGVSIGNEGECSAGTLGARVKDNAGNVYILSNNHVIARENNAPIGSRILQPGTYDALPQCSVKPEDVIGTLAAFTPIEFSLTANNIIDAGIALTFTTNVGNATPSNGYGTPASQPVAATVGMTVKKYGRTTSFTTSGSISSINYTVNVSYTNGTARFIGQILVYKKSGGFIKAGDSGSLLVKQSDNSPVGLLFAGDNRGAYSMANKIGDVLTAYGVTIDGK